MVDASQVLDGAWHEAVLVDAQNNAATKLNYAAPTYEGLDTTPLSTSSPILAVSIRSSTSAAPSASSPLSGPPVIFSSDGSQNNPVNFRAEIIIALCVVTFLALLAWAGYLTGKERSRRAQRTGRSPAAIETFESSHVVVDPFSETGRVRDASALPLTDPLDRGFDAHNVLPTTRSETSAGQAGPRA